MVGGLFNFANAQCVIDQSQLLTNSGLSARNIAGASEGQTFKAGVSGYLCEIDVLMFNPMVGNGTLKIYSGNGVGGALIASQSVYVNVSSGQVWQNWTLSTPPMITSGSDYTFQFIPVQGGGLPDPYGINVTSNDSYSDGYWLSNPGGDLAFRTHVIGQSITASIHADSSTTFCQGGNVVLSSSQQGSPFSFQWLHNNLAIGGEVNADYTATASGNYSVIVDSLGSTDTSNVITVTVNPLPVVSITAIPAFVNYQATPLILSGNPSGGTFSGQGMTGNSFDPHAAGLGSHSILFNYSDGNNCSNSASISTIVYDTMGITCTSYDTVTVNVYDTTRVTVIDTNFIVINDTVLISVTDTLMINASLTGIAPPDNTNIIKVYPNPASTHLFIDNGNFGAMNGYTIRIDNSLGQTVFSSLVNQQQFFVDLSTWTGNGLYFIYVIDNFGNTIEMRKLMLQ